MTPDYYIAAIDGIEKEATFTETEISDLSNNATGKGVLLRPSRCFITCYSMQTALRQKKRLAPNYSATAPFSKEVTTGFEAHCDQKIIEKKEVFYQSLSYA